MEEGLEKDWQEAIHFFEARFGPDLDLEGILFIIGVQELGKGFRTFSKDEKLDVLHVAVCTLLEPYEYYTYQGTDSEGWPHFEREQKLPFLKGQEQDLLMKEAIVNYIRTAQLSAGM